ncbi:hypothetical protein Trydic_g23426 [Trypoxylus dichotomus]
MENPIYISSSCNPTVGAAHWGKNNLICYGSCNAVFIYNPKIGGGRVIKSLIKHKDRVNTVKWIAGNEDETELVSGSSDKTAIVWTLEGDEYVPFVLSGHESNVNVVDGLYLDNASKHLIIATGSADSMIRIWIRHFTQEKFVESQIINLGYGICLAAKFTFLNCGTLLLATALDDSKIHLYVDENLENKNFSEATIITGYNDWVRSIDFTKDGSDLLLASASQDASIQLFRIKTNDDNEGKFTIKTSRAEHQIHSESVIFGHDGWIYSVHWNPYSLKLLSASIDKTLIIWEYNKSVSLWLETTRLGEVGGNTLGFYGAMFGPDGESILAYSYHGAFHLWRINKTEIWTPMVTVNGHFNEVVDIGWDPEGLFLVSISTDQTTRIHAPWKNENHEVTWHEIARPQVHGYDMTSLAILSRYKFVSSGDEKVSRVFQAPETFIQNFKRICRIRSNSIDTGSLRLPKGASVPSLGLSNKAVYESDNIVQATPRSNKEPYPEESHFTATEMYAPPTEETLIQNTLWPEIQKLYGHGYEVYALAASNDGKLVASACKSTTPEHATILVWDTSSWKQIQKLISHTLTVVQMSFSPDSRYLLSVSRDRRWSLFEKNPQIDKFEMVATTDKKSGIHTRIIWTCSWSHDSLYFATGSREGKVVVWTKNTEKTPQSVLGQYEPASAHLDMKESVTALSFAPLLVKDKYLLAVGLESGVINLYLWCKEWLRVLTYDSSLAHHLTVKKLAFRPVLGKAGHKGVEDDGDLLQFASCSSDHSVRLYDVYLNKL